MVKVRFAPSPTGHLHIGGLRAALFNYYFARQQKGKFIIRIEDTDYERNKAEYTKAILDAFEWCGMQSDEPIEYQSQRGEIYQKYIDILLASGAAYRCQELDQEGNSSEVIKCRVDKSISHIVFYDIIRGKISFPMAEFDDFIIVRSDGTPLYNLVVVIDDIEMNITHIIRGEEHLPNTPKQLLLYKAFLKEPPLFAHLPLILGPDRKKLSKRDAATAVIDYKEQGIFPEALCMYLLRLGWAYKDQEIFTQEEIYRYFKLEDIHPSGAIFDLVKLLSVNAIYMKDNTTEELFLKMVDLYEAAENILFSQEIDMKIISLYKDRVSTVKELCDICQNIKKFPIYRLINGVNELFLEKARIIIKEFILLISKNILLKDAFGIIEKEYQYEKHLMYSVLRYAFIGTLDSPSILKIIEIFDQKEILERFYYFLKF